MIKKEDALKLGFESIGHFTIGDNLIYDIGRDRQLSLSCVGTPNEMLFISNVDNKVVTDLVVLHNYDYDGYLTIEKLSDFIRVIN